MTKLFPNIIAVFAVLGHSSLAGEKLALAAGDVVAFIGGGDVAAAAATGHLEALLGAAYRACPIRFRSFGWEGDTVFDQPRDVGFPLLSAQLDEAKASVVVCQFGRGEALMATIDAVEFANAYESLLNRLNRPGRRFVLVTPPPFERTSEELLPDLLTKSGVVAQLAQAVRKLACERQHPLVDLHGELAGSETFTADGLQISLRGHAAVAAVFLRCIGFREVAEGAGAVNDSGVWKKSGYEQVRQAVIAKNRVWFDYSRPQNWAFLGGDRVEQPSSRDHRDPGVRWFPEEMKHYQPLIEAKERKIATLLAQL